MEILLDSPTGGRTFNRVGSRYTESPTVPVKARFTAKFALRKG
jgi:hypothetical protein